MTVTGVKWTAMIFRRELGEMGTNTRGISAKDGQYKMLDNFYRGYLRKGNSFLTGYRISAGIMLLMAGVFMMLPYQYIQEKQFILIVSIVLGYSGAEMHMSAYRVYMNSQNAIVPLWGILQNLPVSRMTLWKYRLKKLVVFQFKFYVVAQVIQLLFSIQFGYGVEVSNFLYPLLAGFIWPVLANGFILYRDSTVTKVNIG